MKLERITEQEYYDLGRTTITNITISSSRYLPVVKKEETYVVRIYRFNEFFGLKFTEDEKKVVISFYNDRRITDPDLWFDFIKKNILLNNLKEL
jgi:hypothetical protein